MSFAKFTALIAGAVLSLAVTSANATMLVGSPTDATGINGLVINGKTYDVTFGYTLSSPFTPGTVDSGDAAIALSTELFDAGVTGILSPPAAPVAAYPSGFFIDVDNTATVDFDGVEACFPTETMCTGWNVGISTSSPFSAPFVSFSSYDATINSNGPVQYYVAADFTPVGVPEPLTLSLFGVALAGAAAAMGRRRKTSKA